MSSNKKLFWAWVGQNATFGTPNQRTGLRSMHGSVRVFSTKKKRDDYVDYYRPNGSEDATKESRGSLRKYHFGMTLSSFNSHLDEVQEFELDEYANED